MRSPTANWFRTGGEVKSAALEIVSRLGRFPNPAVVLGIPSQARIIGRRLGGNRLDDRDDLLLELREKFAERGGFHPAIIEIDQRIDDVFVPRKKVRHLTAEIHGLLQVWKHFSEVVQDVDPGLKTWAGETS
jgi:hypothetical protein